MVTVAARVQSMERQTTQAKRQKAGASVRAAAVCDNANNSGGKQRDLAEKSRRPSKRRVVAQRQHGDTLRDHRCR
jgi:hypothetical protein